MNITNNIKGFGCLISVILLLFSAHAKGQSVSQTGCSFTENRVDQITGAVVKILKREPLVSYLGDPEKTSGLIDDSFTAYVYIANYNGSFVLYMKMEVLSEDAPDKYGSVFAGDQLLLKLKNNTVIALEAGKSEVGRLNGIITSYSSFYPIPTEALDDLKAEKLEKVRIHWSNGYLDYDIDNKDLLIRQLSCAE